MCWDGQTKQAELIIDDCKFKGHPEDVQRIFDLLNNLNTGLQRKSQYIQELFSLIDSFKKKGW
jgi:flagellin-specific chaperone FliS